jgi:hypothetical protein
MRTKEEIEQLANKRYLQKAEAITDSAIKGFIVSATKGGFIDGYTQCQEDMIDKKYTEEDMLKYAWFLFENIGQYPCDKTANFEGNYLEQFKNKQD